MIILVKCMDIKKVEEKKDFKKVDKITRNFVVISCVVLGSVFLAACVYMLTLISDAQNSNTYTHNNYNVQNMNLVSM